MGSRTVQQHSCFRCLQALPQEGSGQSLITKSKHHILEQLLLSPHQYSWTSFLDISVADDHIVVGSSFLRYCGPKDTGGAMWQEKGSLLDRCLHHQDMVYSLSEYLPKIIRIGGKRCFSTRKLQPILLGESFRHCKHYIVLAGHWDSF